MQVAVQGSGPLVLLCHGFPELWISWQAPSVGRQARERKNHDGTSLKV
jgi:hypothetical protein